ncbi:MAG TPA: hypothetical protein PLV68_18800 [Ilumatobacteraceae bacterium]|nr:hypothetical protein [Ilumatobacteraceae bacterium]
MASSWLSSGCSSVSGGGGQPLPEAIQSVLPVRNATQVQQQESIFVDLAEGYTGTVTINGVVLETVNLSDLSQNPTDSGAQVKLPPTVIFEPGNFTLTFTPTDGALVERFLTGVNVVSLVYWKIVDGPNFARTFTWQFDVI